MPVDEEATNKRKYAMLGAMKRILAVIFFTVFIDLLGVGMIVPVLPQLLGNPDSPLYLLSRTSESVKLGLILHGILFSLYAIGQFIASPLLGQLSDRIGRRKVLAGAMFLTAIAQAGFGYAIGALSLVLLFITRFIAGLASGNIPVAQAVITDAVPEEKRSSAMGIIGAAFGLGLIIGPYIGGKLIVFGPAVPFWIAAALAFINGIFLLAALRETHTVNVPKSELSPLGISLRAAFVEVRKAFTHSSLRAVYIVYFLMQLGFAMFMSFATVHFSNRFHFSAEALGIYFAFTGLCAVIAQVIVVRYVARHHTEQSVLSPGLALNALGLLGIAIVGHVTMLYVATFILAIGYGLVHANTPALLSLRVEKAERGVVLGYLGSVQALGLAIPPLFAGFMAASFSAQSVLITAAAIVAWASYYFHRINKAQS